MLAARTTHKRVAPSPSFTDAEFAAMSPAARNAATQAWIDRAQKLEPGTTQNRDFRETCGQGPSFDLLSNLSGNDGDDFDPRDPEPEPDMRRRAGEDEVPDFGVGATTTDTTDAADAQIEIDTDSTGLGFAVANPFCTDTRVARGGPARSLGKNAWNAILALTPLDDPDRDVVAASAQCGAGESARIGMMVGLSPRRVRQIQDRKLKSALENFTSADLRAHRDDPIATEIVARRQPSRAGRKPKGTVTVRAPRVLVLAPKMAGPAKLKRPYRPRRPRPRFADPAQIDMFQQAA